ncbi:tail fiber assembly [Vibrio phage K165]|nr:hypothetical protein MYOV022v2_p0059 [Vibrio phage 12E28.1]QZI90228.1 hypothetical protein MYOV021v2_p0059 [Vibrio phage 18E29.1]QZI90657.1 hypothetical protein MYOV020v1_p0031 [Vibrio phage 98E28.6a]
MNNLAHHYNPGTLIYTHSSPLNTPSGYDSPLIPQCSSLVALPEYDNETQQCKLNSDGKSWVVMGKYKKVTAYNKQSKSQKEFDDESLITDEYTLKTPTTQFDEWNNGDWIANKELTLTHELKILDVNFNKDVKLLTDSMAIAMLEDTSNDQSEMSKLKARYATRKEQYEFDKIELIKKFELE